MLSVVYMLFFLFIPGTLAPRSCSRATCRPGLFYTTAQSLNWVLGAASYFLLPSLGPIYAEPGAFARPAGLGRRRACRSSCSTSARRSCATRGGRPAQSIGAFSSLHVSIFFTAALAAHLLGLGAALKIAAWALLGLTTPATIYFGWHYVLDDLGGLVIGVMAIAMARALTGFDLRRARPPTPRPCAGVTTRRCGRRRDVARRRRGPGGRRRHARRGADHDRPVGLPLRDPDHVAALYLGLVGFGMLRSWGWTSRSGPAGAGRLPAPRARCGAVRRERWTPWRGSRSAAR